MVKKGQSVRVKVPFVEYRWYKEISKRDVDLQYLQNLIDSYLIFIKNKNSNWSELHGELTEFTRLVVTNGHLVKLNKEYQDKFFEISEFIEEQWGGPGIHIFNIGR